MRFLMTTIAWNAGIGAALAILVTLLVRMSYFRDRSRLTHLLWVLVLAKLVTPPLIPVPMLRGQSERALSISHSSALTPPPEEVNAPVVSHAEPIGLPPTAAVESTQGISGAQDATPLPRLAAEGNLSIWFWLLVVSGCGTIAVFARAIRDSIRVAGMLRHAKFGDTRMERLAQRAVSAMNVRSCVAICTLDAVGAPFLWVRWRDAAIVIPAKLAQELDDGQLACIFADELAHLRRRDHWFNLFAFVVRALYWWHPAVWWAEREMRKAQETCSDLMAIGRLGLDRRTYAETLWTVLDFVQTRQERQPMLASGFGNGTTLLRRFEMIANKDVSDRLSRWTWTVVALCCAGLFCVPIRGAADPEADPGPNGQTVGENAKAPPFVIDKKRRLVVNCRTAEEVEWDYGAIGYFLGNDLCRELGQLDFNVVATKRARRWREHNPGRYNPELRGRVLGEDGLVDVESLGRALGADYVVDVELQRFSSSLFSEHRRARAKLWVRVIALEKRTETEGKTVPAKTPFGKRFSYEYPSDGHAQVPRPSFAEFQCDCISHLAKVIAEVLDDPNLDTVEATRRPKGLKGLREVGSDDDPSKGPGRPELVVRNYDVGDLVLDFPVAGNDATTRAAPDSREKAGQRMETLSKYLQRRVSPASWDEKAPVGPSGGSGSIRPFEKTLSLVIRAPEGVHDEIADKLSQLRGRQSQAVMKVRLIQGPRRRIGPLADAFSDRSLEDADVDRILGIVTSVKALSCSEPFEMTLSSGQGAVLKLTNDALMMQPTILKDRRTVRIKAANSTKDVASALSTMQSADIPDGKSALIRFERVSEISVLPPAPEDEELLVLVTPRIIEEEEADVSDPLVPAPAIEENLQAK